MKEKKEFQGFKWDDNQAYRAEAVEKYGQEVIDRADQQSKGHEANIESTMNDIFTRLAQFKEKEISPDSEDSQTAVGQLFQLFNEYIFDCTLQVFGQIGEGYVSDARFQKNIDQFGPGTAEFARDAIRYYVKQV